MWDDHEDAKNGGYFVLLKGEKAAKVAFYTSSKKEIMKTTIFRDEWKMRGYQTLNTKKTRQTDSIHARKIIQEFFEFGELIFSWDK